MKKILLFFLLVVPGVLGVGVSAYWAYWDFLALSQPDQHFQELVSQGASERELFIAVHRGNVHRINVAAEGVWMGMGAILAGMGILGLTHNGLAVTKRHKDVNKNPY